MTIAGRGPRPAPRARSDVPAAERAPACLPASAEPIACSGRRLPARQAVQPWEGVRPWGRSPVSAACLAHRRVRLPARACLAWRPAEQPVPVRQEAWVAFPALEWERTERPAEQTPQAAPSVPCRVQRAGSREAPAVAVPVSRAALRSSEARKGSVFAGPAAGQPAVAPREGSEPQEASPSAAAAEQAARRVAALQGSAFAAAAVAQKGAAAAKRGDVRPEEPRAPWAPASAPASVPASVPASASAPAWVLASLAGSRAGPALWLAPGRVWRCPVHSQRMSSRKTPRRRSTRDRAGAIAEIGACRPRMNTSRAKSPMATVRPIDG